MNHRFRDKLIAAFLALLLITVVPVLLLVNQQIETISEAKIEQDLDATRKVFERFQETQLATYSQQARSFILTQPDIRAEIASAGVDTENLFESIFSVQGSAAEAAPPGAGQTRAEESRLHPEVVDQQNRIRSVVQEVALYNDAALFFLTDFKGDLIFSKTAQPTPRVSLAALPGPRAALQGREVFTWWGSQDERLAALHLLPQAAGRPVLYRTFLKPVEFDGEVKGLLGIGFELTGDDLRQITGITQSEVAFLSEGRVYLSSHGTLPAAPLEALVSAGAGDAAPGSPPVTAAPAPPAGGAPPPVAGAAAPAPTAAPQRVLRFAALGEDFLAQPVPVLSTLGEPVGTVLVYRSKTREQAIFNRLRTVLNGIGIAALVVAAGLAYAISHSVARVVRQLFHGVRAVREGNLDVRLDIRSRDEFGELGRAFNEMTAGLKEKEQIRSTFKRYVSSSVVDELLRSADSVKLGGEAKQLTIQFSDIAGFTSLSEALTPEQVVEFLNQYLSQMTAEVEAEQGIVDKYIGDAVMAFWGAPLPLADHADHACRAALRQLRRVAGLREGWVGRGDLSRFHVRVGLHSGEVIVGNIGSDTRMDYTIIGDAVNLASRLEGMNKVYGTHLLISEDTRRLLQGGYVLRELDTIRVVGKSRPVRIYELAGEGGEGGPALLAVHARFAEALALYRERRFGEASHLFATLAAEAGDAPSRTYLERCEAYQAAPPPEGWDGVFQSLSK